MLKHVHRLEGHAVAASGTMCSQSKLKPYHTGPRKGKGRIYRAIGKKKMEGKGVIRIVEDRR